MTFYRTMLVSLLLFPCTASADWRDGKGVVFFDSDEHKVIYRENAFAYGHDDYRGFEFWDGIQKRQYFQRHADRYKNKDFSPNGAIPGVDYSIFDDALTVDNEEEFWPSYFIQISKSNEPITSRPGLGVTGSVALALSASQCTTHRVNFNNPGPTEFDRSVKLKYFPGAFNSFELKPKDSYTIGWSACTVETEQHRCFSDDSQRFTTEIWAQRESKTKYTWAKVWPSKGKIGRVVEGGDPAGSFRYNARKRLKQVCKAAKGKYFTNWWNGANSCKGTWQRVYWRSFQRYPTKRSATSKHCRLIKAFN